MSQLDRRNTNALIVTFAVLLALFATGAQPASAAYRAVSPTGSDTGNDCLVSSTPCATIQHAINEAGNGDEIDVQAGTYIENLTIDKPLRLLGPNSNHKPGEPQAIVDGGSGTAIKPESHGIGIERMTVTASAAGTAIRASGANVDDLQIRGDIISGGSSGVRLEAGGEEITINSNLIEGVGDGIHLSGTNYFNLVIEQNHFESSISSHALLADSGTTIEGFEFWGNHVSAPTRIAARMKRPQYLENDLNWNSFDSTSGPQLAIDGDGVRVLSNSFEGNGTTGCLQILGAQGGLTPSTNVLVSIYNEFIDCNPYGIELGPEVDDITIYDSDFPGTYDGIITSNASPWDVTGHVHIRTSRFVGVTHLAVDNTASGTLDAEQNWWGCNAGPGAAGCEAVGGSVDAGDAVQLAAPIGPPEKETWIVEPPTGSSIALNPGEKAEVGALLTTSVESPILGVPTENVPIHFSSSLGTLSGETAYLQNGWTTAMFTAGATPGQGWITVSMDNQQTLVPVTIRGDTPRIVAATPSLPATPIEMRSAPSIVVYSKRHLRANLQATVGVVSCANSCRVVPGRAWIVVGHRRFRGKVRPRGTLAAESTTPIRVALPPPAQRALEKLGSARIRVGVTVVDSAGQTATRVISVKVQG